MRTFGVEEELLLVDDRTGRAIPAALDVLAHYDGGLLTKEFKLEQIEIVARPQEHLGDFSEDIRTCRAEADAAARAAGARIAALGSYPMELHPHPYPDARYDIIAERYGITSAEQLTCGCHVHVQVESDEEAVAVLDRIRVWLPVMLALSANSPFWQGKETNYVSYRSQTWQRLPATGPCEVFGSAEAYWQFLQDLLETGVPLDEGTIYFDARVSRHHPTVEIRVADVCLEAGDTVLQAALARALVETASREWQAGVPAPAASAAMLRMATWRASRWGLCGFLLDPDRHCPRPAMEVVDMLLDHAGPVLSEAGDDGMVGTLLDRILRRGTGTSRQRAVLRRTGRLADVVLDAVSVTNQGASHHGAAAGRRPGSAGGVS